MTQQTWFATVIRPRRRLIATSGVWTWFIAALVGAAMWPQLAIWLNSAAAASVSLWYVAMMRAYREARRPAYRTRSRRHMHSSR